MSSVGVTKYHEEDYEGGACCHACRRGFEEGDDVHEQLEGVKGDTVIVNPLCAACAVRVSPVSAGLSAVAHD